MSSTITTRWQPTYLVVNDELGVLVEDRVLALCEGGELRQGLAGVDVVGRRLHDAIRLLDHMLHVHRVTVVEKILQKDISDWLGRFYHHFQHIKV